MSLKESNMMKLGTLAPDFNLPDTISGSEMSLDQFYPSKGLVMMFICNHCPYVIHVNSELISIAHYYESKGIKFVAISSNDVVNYTDDSPDKMSLVGRVLQYPFPYLYDEDQSVAKAYDAACTPDIYLFDEKKELHYRGRLDGSRPGNDILLNGQDLRKAIDNLLENNQPLGNQYPSAGCNIKWKR